jgi:hypothetical protein
MVSLFATVRNALFGKQSDDGKAQPIGADDSGWTIGNPGARHPYEVTSDHPAARFIGAMPFCATFQTRTPLRILRRHGQVLPLGTTLPDDFDPWMGIWVPKPKTFGEIGIDIDEPELEQVVASPAGPVIAAEYLPFLMAVREAVEDTAGGTEARMERLRAVCGTAHFARYVAAEGGPDALCDRFFPPVLSLISGLPSASRAALRQLGLSSVQALRHTPDSELLAVCGIGPSKLKAIREFCGGYSDDPEAERRVDLVT